MAPKVDINKVKYYKSRLPLTVITKGLKKGSQLLIGRLIYRCLPISMKRTILPILPGVTLQPMGIECDPIDTARGPSWSNAILFIIIIELIYFAIIAFICVYNVCCCLVANRLVTWNW